MDRNAAAVTPTAPKPEIDRGDGWHELQVANPSFLVEKLGAECGDLQGLRELTVNGIEAIAALGAGQGGRIIWDLDWERAIGSDGRVRKLSVTDTGTGMTADQMYRYINQLAASSREQSRTGNFGVRRQGRRRVTEPPRSGIPLLASRTRGARQVPTRPPRPLGA
jgi:hypothetical protein